jgi:hypothetical protein
VGVWLEWSERRLGIYATADLPGVVLISDLKPSTLETYPLRSQMRPSVIISPLPFTVSHCHNGHVNTHTYAIHVKVGQRNENYYYITFGNCRKYPVFWDLSTQCSVVYFTVHLNRLSFFTINKEQVHNLTLEGNFLFISPFAVIHHIFYYLLSLYLLFFFGFAYSTFRITFFLC